MPDVPKKRDGDGPKPAPARSGNPAVRAAAPRTQAKPGGSSQPRTQSAARTQSTPRSVSPPSPPSRSPFAVLEDASVLPVDGVEYPQILRNANYALWRSLAGVAFGLSLFLLMTSVVSQAVIALFWALNGRTGAFRDYYTAAIAFEKPSGMLGANLSIATLIPIAWVLMIVVHRVHPRWLASVQPKIRWRYLLLCVGVAAIALNGVLWLSTLSAGMPTFGMQPGFWGFLVVIVLTSPLQAAAEEIFFRGYLMQALGSLVAAPWFGVVVSSLVFALLHGTQNLPLFLDRLIFGLLAALLVWRTGGLEAGIAAHVINNVFAYLVAGLTTSIATVRGIQEIGWLDAGFDVGGFALFAVLAYLLARKLKLRTRVDLKSVA